MLMTYLTDHYEAFNEGSGGDTCGVERMKKGHKTREKRAKSESSGHIFC